ncbi:ABC transporter ATP-binding protein [Candidatus Bathyarchaeota archaeon]|nr:ABC transporter ATP-binding protein [Candidatus Bathyarchaeota archaeon]
MGFHGGGGIGSEQRRGPPWMRRDEKKKSERKVSDKNLLKRLIKYIVPFRQRMAILALLMLLGSIAGLLTPLLTQIVFDNIIVPGMVSGDKSGLTWWVMIMVALALGNWGLNYGRTYLISWIGNSTIYRLREDLFAKLQVLSLKYFAEGDTGRTMSRVTNDAETLSRFLGFEILDVISEAVTIFGSLFLMFSLSFNLTLVSLLTIPIMLAVPLFMRSRMRSTFRQARQSIAGVTSVLQESVSGIRVVQAFSRETQDAKTFDYVNMQNLKANLRVAMIAAFFHMGITIVRVAGTVILLWYGVTQIVAGNITLGVLIAFQLYMMRFMRPIMMLANFYNSYQEAMAGAERIFELMDMKIDVEEPPKTRRIELSQVNGEIKYDRITFEYEPGVPVLKDINLTISPNEKVAFVGPTGAGKTTMINLLCRFYDPTEGAVFIDGHNVHDVSFNSLRDHMGIVPQDSFLFQNTVRENIRYGKPEATDEEIANVTKVVGAHDFINRLPEGYDTMIREGATNISIGQRQLIAFSRALLKNPRILILDEATSSVDPYTELIIQEGLEKLLENRTSIIIAHRLSTVRNADRIVVINQGEIAEMGNHQQLMKKGGLYSHLYNMQFREPEIES